MQTKIDNSAVLDTLPLPLRKAQEAIGLPEVQEMIKNLAKYNLGVYMPHKHDEETGGFEVLPNDQVQIEDDLTVSFSSRKQSKEMNSLPVGWTWINDGVHNSAECSMQCSWVTSPTTGSAVHIKQHK